MMKPEASTTQGIEAANHAWTWLHRRPQVPAAPPRVPHTPTGAATPLPSSPESEAEIREILGD